MHKFLSKIAVMILAIGIALPACVAESNLPMPDIGDHGVWMTDNNQARFMGELTNDMNNFAGITHTQIVDDYVPVEAKVGLAFMNAMSFVTDVLDSALVRFAIAFIFIAYAFWVMFETYNMMKGGKGEIQKHLTTLVKRGLTIVVWVIILRFGPARIFMWVMGPIISVSTYVSDIILNSITQMAGITLPDTCGAIREYTIANISGKNIIDATAAADIMCVPTRLSGFCATAIAAGWQWMIGGIGHSAFSFIVGLVFIVAFIFIGWKFLFMALGVIADLFLGIMMLPFTAIAETIGKTSYKGIAGDIFNQFLGVFKAESLQQQIQRFIDAAIYFVSLSVVIAVCAALLSGVITPDLATNIPSIENTGTWMTMLIAALTWWLASRAMNIAKDLTGKSVSDSFGQQVQKDVTGLWKSASGSVKSWWKAFKDSK